MRVRIAQVALSLGVFVLLLGAIEVGLRLAGFSYEIDIDRVEFGWPDPEVREDLFDSDPDLFWVSRDYRQVLHSLRKARVDLLFVGDSVVFASDYPRLLAEELSANENTRRVTTGKLGVGGWSSYQGLEALRRDLAQVRPAVLVLSFGWNDHWFGWGVADSELHALRDSWLSRLGAERLAQLLLKARLGLRELRGLRVETRVPLDNFRHNLSEMARIARGVGATPVFLTAATLVERGAEPAYLGERWLHDVEQLVPLHEAYVEAVKEVGASEGAIVCDLYSEFRELHATSEDADWFMDDAIHFLPDGSRVAADLLLACFERNGVIEQLERSAEAKRRG